MQTTIGIPQAFSVRDEHEFYPFQHLLARLNPELRVVQIATGVHIHGGCTVLWGLVYQDGQVLTQGRCGGSPEASRLRFRPQRADSDARIEEQPAGGQGKCRVTPATRQRGRET